MTDATPTLRIEALSVGYRVKGQVLRVLQDLTFEIGRGEAYGLVGESGCGKSTAAFAAMRYLPRNGRIEAGRIIMGGEDVYGLDSRALQSLRRNRVAMVYQDPGKSLNPSIRIGAQMAEVFELLGEPRQSWRDRSVGMLDRVRITDPDAVLQRYPHQLSGGMQQRVSIAMALASNPSLLILDEPTTGLDATVEAEVLDLILQLRQEYSTSILFISHNLAVVARMCERVGVLYAGRMVEEGPTRDLFRQPRHPYTGQLLRCLPRQDRSKSVAPLATIPGFLPPLGSHVPGCIFADRCPLAEDRCRDEAPPLRDLGGRTTVCHYPERVPDLAEAAADIPAARAPAAQGAPVMEMRDLSKTFRIDGKAFRAVNGISLTLREGETLGLVGESGSGKTTLARSVLGLTSPDTDGAILLDGKPLPPRLSERTLEEVKALQIVFQNPDSALNRAHSVRRMIGRTIARLTRMPKARRADRVLELTRSVRLTERQLGARPSQLSGGLKQRVAIARAFAGEPRVVICDEPTSALDVSVQAAILNLLVELQSSEKVSYIFISHDLGVVRYISDRIAVLYLGRLLEIGPADAVFDGPHHPYTEALLSSVPSIDGDDAQRVRLGAEVPSATNPPGGCIFHTRCPRKIGPICEEKTPPEISLGPEHVAACHVPVSELHRNAV
ncbi:ABC transporter ATP-binding protein [Sulfitobacter sp. LCG007]